MIIEPSEPRTAICEIVLAGLEELGCSVYLDSRCGFDTIYFHDYRRTDAAIHFKPEVNYISCQTCFNDVRTEIPVVESPNFDPSKFCRELLKVLNL